MFNYIFLVADGNAAASRGTEDDNFFEVVVEAESLWGAYRNGLLEIIGSNADSLEEFLLDTFFGAHSYEDLDEEEKENFDNFDAEEYINGMDTSGGASYVVAIARDGNIQSIEVTEESYEGILEKIVDNNEKEDFDPVWFKGRGFDDPISIEDIKDFLGAETPENDEVAAIIYKWLENEDSLYEDKDDILDYDNLLDLCDSATNIEERNKVAHAIGCDIYDDDAEVDESVFHRVIDPLIESFKEELDLEDCVNDAYNYFTNNLGMDPSATDIIDFIDNNYEDFREVTEADRSEIEKLLDQFRNQ